jgi:tetratricopeptide (TPR) repeat protein
LAGSERGTVPAGIAGTVIARVNRLSTAARSLADTAAVAGAGFDADVVRQACGWSFSEVFDGLDELLDGSLVRVSPQRRGEFAFSHQLVHAAVYDAIDPATRRGLHRRIAKALERLFPDRLSLGATIARHYDAAGLDEDAVARYLAAARYALDVFAQEDTVALATRGLELSTSPRDRFALLALREEARRRAADVGGRGTDCASMLEIAEGLGDDELLGTALLRTVTRYRQHGVRDDEQAAIDRLRELGARSGSPELSLEAALAQARMEINFGKHADAATIFARAEPLAAEVRDDGLALEFWVLRANTVLGTPEARAFLERARPFTGDSPLRTIRWLRAKANVADFDGDAETLRDVATELLERYTAMGDLDGQASAHLQLALCAWYRLDVAAQREHNRLALELFERVEKPNSIAAVLINRGVSSQRLGDFSAAEADYLRARSISEAVGQREQTYLTMINFASVAWMRGDYERARQLAHEAAAFSHQHRLPDDGCSALGFAGRAERDLGKVEAAREHLEASLLYRRTRDPRAVLEALVEIIPVRLALGDVAGALVAAEELMTGLEGNRMRVNFPARALSVAASAFDAAGESDRARTLHDEASALLRELSGRIADEPSRTGYLSHRFHQAILAKNGSENTRAETLKTS